MAVRKQHLDDPGFARLTVTAVGLEFSLPHLTLDANQRSGTTKPEVFARQIAAYLCQTVFNMSIPRVAQLFSRDRSTITHALNVIEEAREDPVFNRKLLGMEAFLTHSLQIFRPPAPPRPATARRGVAA